MTGLSFLKSERLALSGLEKYSIIYADPPWDYNVWGKNATTRSAASHYKVATLASLKEIPVASIAAKNAVLLMWATAPLLPESLELGSSWGFQYKTIAFTWIKMYKHAGKPFVGLGYYTRANAELVLLFTRGKPLPRASKNIEQVIMSKIGRHSQKPDEVRKRIVQLFGDQPRIELFARSRPGLFSDDEYRGWDVFGDEANNSISF